jgi:hypothetical protein
LQKKIDFERFTISARSNEWGSRSGRRRTDPDRIHIGEEISCFKNVGTNFDPDPDDFEKSETDLYKNRQYFRYTD